MEDAAFARDRLAAVVPRLHQRRKELLAAGAYDKAKTERDQLAAELANIYPAFSQKVSELLPRIEANDRRIQYINGQATPSGAEPLLVAELVARGLPSFNPKPSSEVPRITRELRLPTFEYPGEERYVWPRGYRLA
jgi:hypothetical protein